MAHPHRNGWLIVLVIVGLLMSGCSRAAATQEPEGSYGAESTEAPPVVDMPERSAYLVSEPSSEDESGADIEIEQPAQQQERMIVKNGAITLLVDDPDSAISRVTQVATDGEGYVLSSEVYGSGDEKNATVTLTVRSDQFEASMERLRGIAIEVLSESATGQDVTSEYVDLESRLRTLEVTRERIQGFLDQAQTVEEALDVSRELTSIDAEIEQIKGRMQYLSGRSAYSTITVQIRVDPPEEEATAFSANETVQQAMKAQAAIFQGLIQLLIWLVIVPGPYLLVGGLIFAGVRWWVKRQ